MPLLRSAERREREGQVYDFQRRRYGRKGRARWSDAHRSRENSEQVLYARDRYGRSYCHEGSSEKGLRFGGGGEVGHRGLIRGYGVGIDGQDINDAELDGWDDISSLGGDYDSW